METKKSVIEPYAKLVGSVGILRMDDGAARYAVVGMQSRNYSDDTPDEKGDYDSHVGVELRLALLDAKRAYLYSDPELDFTRDEGEEIEEENISVRETYMSLTEFEDRGGDMHPEHP
jgi:hypothetical protein